jgi:type I restriction enzyme S subunit
MAAQLSTACRAEVPRRRINAQQLWQHFDTLAETPDAVAKLRKLVLDLAVSGRLVPQLPSEGNADSLVLEIAKRRQQTEGKARTAASTGISSPIAVAPFAIPQSWRWSSIGIVGRVVAGATPDSKNSSFFADEGIPWLTPADLYRLNGKYIARGRRCLTKAGLDSCSAQVMPAGAVLFSSRAPIGYVKIAKNPICTNQGFKSCVPHVAGLSDFLYYYLHASVPRIEEAASGTTFKEISGKDFALVPVPLPPLAEQRRIVAKVEELLALCDELEEAQTAAREHRTRLVRSALDHLATGVRPSSGAAAWCGRRALEFSGIVVRADLAAPEDGRTPHDFRRHAAFVLNQFPHLTAAPEDVPALRQAILSLAVQGHIGTSDKSDW